MSDLFGSMKQIQITEEIRARLEASLGEGMDTNGLVVFEAIAANMNPLRRRSGLYAGARFSVTLMQEMATRLEQESVPLQIQHDTSELPSGRVFMGRVEDEQLHILFFLDPNSDDSKLIAKINSGVIDQVSVGILPKKLLCSECQFDYLGDEANFEHLWTTTCENGHVIGEDGIHIRMSGLDSFFETSLVGQGAVDGAKIVSGSKSAFADRSPAFRLAASAIALHTHPQTLEDEPEMDLKAFTSEVSILTAAKLAAENSLTAAQAELATATTSLTAMTAERDEANTKLEAANARIAELEGTDVSQVETLTASNTKAVEFLTKQATRVAAALGLKDPEIPETLEELTAFLDDKQAALSAAIPDGPVARGNGSGTPEARPATSGAFKSARN